VRGGEVEGMNGRCKQVHEKLSFVSGECEVNGRVAS